MRRASLTDFGLAKLVQKESTLTHTNAILGTPALAGVIWQWTRAEQQAARATKTAEELRQNLYASEMNIAFQTWEMGDVARARSLLAAQVPNLGDKDVRGWEWRYLSRARRRRYPRRHLPRTPARRCGAALHFLPGTAIKRWQHDRKSAFAA
jgi:hypothetical protein